MLALGALGNAGPVVGGVKGEVIWTGAGECGSLHVVGCNEAEM